MAIYAYRVMRDPETVMSGRLEAESRPTAVRELFARGYHVVSVEEIAHDREKPWWRISWFDRVRHRDVTLLTRQLSNLLRAGLPLSQALETLAQQTPNHNLQSALRHVLSSVRDGSTLSDSLSSEPGIFSPLYVALVRAGESGGMLDDVLKKLSELMLREDDTRARLRSMVTYPAVLITLGICTVTALLTFVIPRFVVMFRTLGQSLPIPTLVLIRLSRFFQAYWWILVLGAIGAAILLRRFWHTEQGRRLFDRLFLRVPVLGTLLMKSELSRFARVVGELLHNGVTILSALEIAGATLTNRVYRDAVHVCHKGVKEGEPLSDELKKTGKFPDILTNIVAVAEESGNLDDALIQTADDYELEVTRGMATLMSLLEPGLIICVGVVVGFIVVAMLLPIFELNAIIQ